MIWTGVSGNVRSRLPIIAYSDDDRNFRICGSTEVVIRSRTKILRASTWHLR